MAGPGNVEVNKSLLSRGPQVGVLSPWDLPFGFSDVTAEQVGDEMKNKAQGSATKSLGTFESRSRLPGGDSWVVTQRRCLSHLFGCLSLIFTRHRGPGLLNMTFRCAYSNPEAVTQVDQCVPSPGGENLPLKFLFARSRPVQDCANAPGKGRGPARDASRSWRVSEKLPAGGGLTQFSGAVTGRIYFLRPDF